MAADRRVYLLKRANKLFRHGKIEPAIEEYKKILIIKPDDKEVRRIVGDLHLKQNNIPEAIEQYEWIADYYLKEGFFAKAMAMYKKITRLVPGHEGAQLKLAELYAKQGLIMEAKQIYLGIVEKYLQQSNREKILYIYKKIFEFDKGIKQELKRTLEELSQLTDTHSSNEEQLPKRTEQQEKKDEKAEIEIDFDAFELDPSMSREIKRGVEEKSTTDSGAPFKEIYDLEVEFDGEEELWQDEAYLEIEKNVDNELKSIKKFNQAKPSLTLPSEPHGKDKHQVMCTVFSPPLVKTGSEILVQVFAHLYEKSDEALQMATEFDEDTKRRGAKSLQTAIPKGTELMFELKMKDAVIAEPTRTMIWNGYTESVAFDVKIPEDFTKNSLIGKVVISQNTVPIGMINFRIKIQKIEDKIPTRPKPLPIGEAKIYKYAFVSYASEDREEVLRRVQMLSLLKIDYFQDIFSLNPGDRWEKKLYQKIDEADVFFLFWSSAARDSQWVRKELSYAIQRKQGIDENPPEIIPVIIEGPPVPAPPAELKHIHFNDKMIYFIAGMGTHLTP